MSDKDNIKVTPFRASVLATLLIVTCGLAIYMLGSFTPIGKAVQEISETLEKLSADPAMSHKLPDDLCVIDGKPLTPELDYIGYGSHPGPVLKYTNTDGDLMMLVDDQIIGMYEGDFCHPQ